MLVHTQLATLLQKPALAISDDEAKALATAGARVAALYDLGMTEKQQAWSGLMMTAAGIYGPRLYVLAFAPKPARPIPAVVQGGAVARPAPPPNEFRPTAPAPGANLDGFIQ